MVNLKPTTADSIMKQEKITLNRFSSLHFEVSPPYYQNMKYTFIIR